MTEGIDFNKVYKEYHPKIFRYLSQLIGNYEADDVTQEVFTKVSRGLEGFKGESKFSTWLYRIATNTALDRLKVSPFKHSIESLTSREKEEVEDRDVWTGQRKVSPELKFIRKEMNSCIRDLINKLPSDYKTIIILGEIEGFKNKEIADILEISLDTVKIRRHRARANLKKELETHCTFYRDERNVLSCDLKAAFKKYKMSN
jgi:RNA polymerase sigma-70 factor (ECF subfamily)